MEEQMELWTLLQVYKAARLWYGSTDNDMVCLAENRLNRGERPDGWDDVKKEGA